MCFDVDVRFMYVWISYIWRLGDVCMRNQGLAWMPCAGVYFLYASCVVRVCRSVRGVYAM
jgi:hypothetical protein